MAEASYSKVETTKSRCQFCKGLLTLLYSRVGQIRKPMFYICWMCETITEAGKGEVKSE